MIQPNIIPPPKSRYDRSIGKLLCLGYISQPDTASEYDALKGIRGESNQSLDFRS